MARSLVWVQDDADVGWACSSCSWKFPIPTLLPAKMPGMPMTGWLPQSFVSTAVNRKPLPRKKERWLPRSPTVRPH